MICEICRFDKNIESFKKNTILHLICNKCRKEGGFFFKITKGVFKVDF